MKSCNRTALKPLIRSCDLAMEELSLAFCTAIRIRILTIPIPIDHRRTLFLLVQWDPPPNLTHECRITRPTAPSLDYRRCPSDRLARAFLLGAFLFVPRGLSGTKGKPSISS